ncbi:MAG: hypothetical protein ACK4Q4_09280 [Rhodocyclaceae bacterium]
MSPATIVWPIAGSLICSRRRPTSVASSPHLAADFGVTPKALQTLSWVSWVLRRQRDTAA